MSRDGDGAAQREPVDGATAMLAAAEDVLLSGWSSRDLNREYQRLSDRYRAGLRTPRRITPGAVRAYAAARLPATLAVNTEVLARVGAAKGRWAPRSVLDVGAGLAPSAWAAAAIWPTVEHVTLYEDAPAMAAAGRALSSGSDLAALARAQWRQADGTTALEPAELVVASYVLGEVADLARAVERWWAATHDTLVVIEPGTPAGFERIVAARSQLVDGGAAVVAPCPHGGTCPLAGSGWCYFAVRVHRSRIHRIVKDAAVGAEDEGFSYVAVTRTAPATAPAPRVIRRPVRRGGHVRLQLCTDGGIADHVVPRSDSAYHRARKLRWGDSYPAPAPHPLVAFVDPHLDSQHLRRVTLTARAGGASGLLRRAVLRPVEVQGRRMMQVVTYDEHRSTTINLPDGRAPEIQELLRHSFEHVTVALTSEVLEGRVTKKGRLLTSRSPTAPRPVELAHDRAKRQPIPEDARFLDTLGVAANGRVKPARRAKYRQINEFVRLLDGIRPAKLHQPGAPLQVVDLGCGNAYLTFAVHHHLTQNVGLDCTVVGIDRNTALVDRNNERADTLGWRRLRFEPGDIAAFQPDAPPDVVIALHACDTASDRALAAMVRWDAEAGLVAPCCHHNVQAQLRPAAVAAREALLLRDGVLRERLGDVLTDASRSPLLRLLGYTVDVVQFVDPEHTPRNTLIRAANRRLPVEPERLRAYQELVDQWCVGPFLADLLADHLEARGLTTAGRPDDR